MDATIEPGTRVQVIELLEHSHGLSLAPSFVACRAKGVKGIVIDTIPSYEGAWWVRHDNGAVCAYWHFELQPLPPVSDE